ncbi:MULTISPECIES: hypothetical protein [unclassified Microbacterium]|uniref:hypothetical protein n=1 Tax=unclassified Microbacterium TaxID=2609290 RepID=UPI00342D4C1E
MLRVRIVGLCAVGIEHRDERMREDSQVVRRRDRRISPAVTIRVDALPGIRTHVSTACGVGEALIGARSLVGGQAVSASLDRSRSREHAGDAHSAVEHGVAEFGPTRGKPLTGEQVDVAAHQVDDFADPGGTRSIRRQRALQQLARGPAPGTVRKVDGVARRDGLDDHRLEAPQRGTRRRQDLQPFVR